MLRKHSQTFLLLYKIADLAILWTTLVFAFYLKFRELTIGVQYIFLTMAISVLWYLIASMFNCYDAQLSRLLRYDIKQLAKVHILVFGLISPPLFYLHVYFSRHYILLFFSISFCALFALRIVLRFVLRYLRQRGYNARRLMVIGGGAQARKVIDKVFEHPE